MVSVEEELQAAEEDLKQAENRRLLYSKGVPDFEAYRKLLEEDATNLLLLVRRLNVDEFPGHIDLLEAIQLLINDSKKTVEAIDGLQPMLQPLITQIKESLAGLNEKFQEEMNRQAEARELEKRTLERIKDYIEKHSS